MEVKLNTQQEEAVKYRKGPLLIIAGAGTGKTTVITERIKFLIEQRLAKPSEILALTFTERAAAEMEQRVDQVLPMGYTQTWIGTFHSFCERILRAEAVQVGLSPDFTILSQAETCLFVKEHLFELGLKYFKPLGNPTKFIGGLVTHFARLKNEDVSPGAYLDWTQNQESKIMNQGGSLGSKSNRELILAEVEKIQELAGAYKTYESLKVREAVMDFADLISNTLRLFRQRPNVLQKYQQQFKYILIDEFQDTNYAQNHLAVFLAGDDQNITVVSDDDQAIYRFRGAAVYNVLDFKKHFPTAKVVTLVNNYRSQQEILDRAYHLIQNNNPNRLEIKEKVDKRLKAQVAPLPGRKIRVIFRRRIEDEAEEVASEIAKLTLAPHPPTPTPQFKDIAILVRANNHAQPFIQALNRHAIPHQFLGPGRLYQKPEIKDLIAYLKLLDNFSDDTALYRVLVMPQLGISRRDVAAVVNFARRYNLSLFEATEAIVREAGFQGGDSSALLGRDRGDRKTDFFSSRNNLLLRSKVAGDREVEGIESARYSLVSEEETLLRLQRFVTIVHRHLHLVPHESPGQILYYFVKDIGMLKKLASPRSAHEERQVLNISKFFDKIKAFETKKPEARVRDLVEYLDFVMAAGESPLAAEIDWDEEDAVNIITVHSAKGLEFEVIFLVNLVNDRFPTRHRSDQIPIPDELAHEALPAGDIHEQEERRLFYVGMTRAKQRLYLTGAKFYGEGRRPKKLSPFVFEALGKDLSPYLLKEKEEQQPALFEWRQAQSLKLPPPHSHPSVNYLSYSQINTFEICPLHYKLKYILKIPTLPSSAVSFGRVLHETLREFYESLRVGKPGGRKAGGLERLLELYQKNWLSEGYQGKKHEQERKAQGERYLREFFQKEFDPNVKILALEEPFNFMLGRLKVTGRIDRIDRLSDGSIEIIDYKTGKAQDEKFLKKDLQLSIYALAASRIPAAWQRSLDRIKLSYYYFESGQKITLERTPGQVQKAQEQILAVKEQIETSSFSCSGNLICQKGCEYALFCSTEDNHTHQ